MISLPTCMKLPSGNLEVVPTPTPPDADPAFARIANVVMPEVASVVMFWSRVAVSLS